MAPEISQSDLVYTFFHPLLRDQKNPDIRLRKVKGIYDSKYIIIYERYLLSGPYRTVTVLITFKTYNEVTNLYIIE